MAPKFAVRTSLGTVSVPGLPDLNLAGPTALEINLLGRSINVNIPDLDGVSIPLNFSAADLVNRFGGNLALNIDGFTTLNGTFAFEKQNDGGTTEIRVAATGVDTFLGSNPDNTVGNSDDVGARITNARLGGVLYRTSAGVKSYALDAKGTASIVGVDGFTVTGELAARVNTTGGAVNETITMPSGAPVVVNFAASDPSPVFSGTVTAEVSQFASISGSFSVAQSPDRLTIAASNVEGFVGSGNLGVRVTDGNLGVVIRTNTKKFAAVASGNVALEGVAGLTVTGAGSIRLNKLDEAISETISTPDGPVTLDFSSSADIQQVRSTLNLQFENFVYASGDFLLEKTQVSDLTTITLAASNLNAFLGVNYGIAGEFGVKVTGAGVAMLIEKQGSNAAKYAISTTGGTVGLVGLAGVDLTGPLALNINRLGRVVDVDIPAPSGVTFPLEFTLPDTVQRFGGDLNLNIANFTTLKGTYGFEIETASGATEIRVAGTNINAVLGSNPDGIIGNADDVGARITNAKLGAVLFRTAAGATSYALDAKGTASLVGVSGFILTGDLAARVNTTGGAVNETITLPNGDTVAVTFGATEAAAVFKGIVTAEVSGFATITGGFAVSKSASKLTIAAAGVTAFVGSGDLGVRVTNGKLGAVIKTDTKKFAAVASGDAALEGVAGLTVTGTGSVRINKMSEAVNETITTPSGDVDVVFADGTDILQVRSTLNLQFENFVYASGDFLLEKTQVSDLTTITLAASNLNAFLGVNYGIAGEFGVKVTGAGVAMLIEKQGSNAAKYAISTTGGTVGLVGLPGVDLSGPLALNINRLGRIVDVDIPAPSGVTFPLEFTLPDTVQRFGGDLNLNLSGFTTLTGTYGFEIETASGATEIRVAGTNINAVLGSNPDGIIGNSDDVGARISNANLGAVLFRSAAGATSYALDAKGTATLVGVSGFTLTGDLAARVNTTGGAVNETITLSNGETVAVTFGATEADAVFKGIVTAEVSGFATITGGFAVSKSASKLTIAAAGVTAFVGTGTLGVRVTNGKLGAVIKTDTKKFAAVASGDAALEGVAGLTVTGTGSVRINKMSEAVNETITTPSGDVDVVFADG
ncbi:MAG: beta strand repeat-containing protein, partial [Planctomycetaceae bacterium]